jgi:hypothetical protein
LTTCKGSGFASAMLFILEPNDFSRSLVSKRVTISDYQDGRLVIAYNGRPLAYSIFDKVRRVNPAAVVDNKSLSAVLMKIREEQLQRPLWRSGKAPRRRSQENSIFSAPAPPAPKSLHVRQPDVEAEIPYTTPGYKRRITRPGEVIRPSAHALADRPIFADGPIPEVLANFRFFSRYVVQKRGRRPAPRTRWKKPGPTDGAVRVLPDERLSATVELPVLHKRAA